MSERAPLLCRTARRRQLRGLGPLRRPIAATPQDRRSARRGAALIMVLVITTILGAMALDIRNSSMVNFRAAANARDQLQAHFHARSALELELFVLRFQSQIKSTLGNFLPIPLFELSGFLVSSDTVKGILDRKPRPSEDRERGRLASGDFGDFIGSFWIEEVVDENRKINLNSNDWVGCQNYLQLLIGKAFSDPKYDILFENMEVDGSRDPIRNRIALVANITDWVDGNETVDSVCMLTQDRSINGPSEDTRYDRLPYGAEYKPKNGLMDSLKELRMVPGVNDAFMRLFARYFTVWSDNKGINFTTADDWMLRALVRTIATAPPLPSDEEKFRIFFRERALRKALPPPLNQFDVRSLRELLNAAGFQYDQKLLEQLVSAQLVRFEDISQVYKISAVGKVHDTTVVLTTVWRDPGNGSPGEFYYWHEE